MQIRSGPSQRVLGLLVLCVIIVGTARAAAAANDTKPTTQKDDGDATTSTTTDIDTNRTESKSEDKVFKKHGFKAINENPKTQYIELRLIVDKGTFEKHGSDVKAVHEYSTSLINLVNALYRPLDIVVALVDVVIWKEENPFEYSDIGGDTLSALKEYLRTQKLGHVDNVQLLIMNQFKNGVVGMSFVGTVCTQNWGSYVSTHFNHTLNQTAIYMAHEMGHNLGFEHKDDKCEGYVCVMSYGENVQVDTVKWSPKNFETVKEKCSDGSYKCMKNRPTKLFETPTCGNGFVEDGEECDCGPELFCEDSCCDANTCRLTSAAKCKTD